MRSISFLLDEYAFCFYVLLNQYLKKASLVLSLSLSTFVNCSFNTFSGKSLGLIISISLCYGFQINLGEIYFTVLSSFLLTSQKKKISTLSCDTVYVGRPGSQVPYLQHWEGVDPNMVLLRKEYAWHIGGALSQQELEEWKLLYHSAYNGQSFNTFLGNIS